MLDVLYVTDPSCPWSWGAEPLRRRVEREFDAGVRTTCVMGGLAREFGPPEALVAEWLDAGDASGMPVDPRLWWEGPPRSSFPACLAVVAAREQGFDKALLRRLRVGLMTARRKLDTTEALLAPGTAIDLPEAAALCDLPAPRAAAELWRLTLESRARPERRLTGELWSAG